jgi:hypothetical protein
MPRGKQKEKAVVEEVVAVDQAEETNHEQQEESIGGPSPISKLEVNFL